MPSQYPRFADQRLRVALSDTPVVAVNGPRQSGKTTLVRSIAGAQTPYLTLDNATTRDRALADPTGFIRSLDTAILDEVQRAPDLLLAIKQSVDEDRRPGRFLLTGSANFFTIPKLGDSLAGRMEVTTLLPLAQSEIRGGSPSTFLDALFNGHAPTTRALAVGANLVSLVLAGGFPDAISRSSGNRRRDWHRAYVDALILRDIPEIATIDRPLALAKLLDIIAQHAGQLVNLAQIGASVGVTAKTIARYLDILESVYLIRRLPAWSRNELKRLVKTPKLHFIDSGLLSSVLGVTEALIASDRLSFGPLLETFVFQEILKLTGWSDDYIRMSYFRDIHQHEVDLVLENDLRQIVGIEIKAAATVTRKDLLGLKQLATLAGEAFQFGIVLYDGDQTIPLGPKLAAVPVSSLWA